MSPSPTTTTFFGTVTVPDVVGFDQFDADRACREVGLSISVVTIPDDFATPGTVIEQNPPAYSSLPRGSVVELVVSSGADEFEGP